MASQDERARAQAARTLAPKPKGKGQAVTLRQPAVTQYDPATDTTVEISPAQDHDGSGIETKYDMRSIAAGLVAAGDVKFLLSPLKINGSDMPRPVSDSWTLTKADGTWTIKLVTPTSPAGLDVMFELQLRRS